MKNYYRMDTDQSNDINTIMSVAEVAEYLSVGKNRIYELLNNGTIKGFRMGSSWKISKLALDTYIITASGL